MKQIPFIQTIELLQRHDIPVVPSSVFTDKKGAWEFISRLKKAAAMKIDAAEIWHRTEAEGVFLNINRKQDFDQAWQKLSGITEARGIIVQEMSSGIELALGAKRDPQFGPVVMFGLGGILIELMQDVSFRIAPIDLAEARRMISEIKGYRLLTGFRGRPAVDQDKLVELLVNLGNLAAEHPEIEEVDLNPVMVDGQKVEVVDAKIWVLEHEG